MIGKRGIKAPPTMAELQNETRRLTKQAFFLAPAALVVAIVFGVLGSRTMATAFLAISIFTALMAVWINILMIWPRYLYSHSRRLKQNEGVDDDKIH